MIYSQLTNGFGNNLFQCIAGKMLAHHHKTQHFFIPVSLDYYGTSYLQKLGFNCIQNNQSLDNVLVVDDTNYLYAFHEAYKDKDLVLTGYFEDKSFYEPNRKIILSWFENVVEKNKNDLVFHFRTGDRLFYKNEFNTKPTPEIMESAINNFDFNDLYIVSDIPEWRQYNSDELAMLKFHVSVDEKEKVSYQEASDYYNSCFEMLQKYNPIFVKRNVLEDFNFIRKFDNILFQHGTMSWWAAFLSEASKVGVYGPWRPWKGKSNKNLSKVKIDGWFTWGD